MKDFPDFFSIFPKMQPEEMSQIGELESKLVLSSSALLTMIELNIKFTIEYKIYPLLQCFWHVFFDFFYKNMEKNKQECFLQDCQSAIQDLYTFLNEKDFSNSKKQDAILDIFHFDFCAKQIKKSKLRKIENRIIEFAEKKNIISNTPETIFTTEQKKYFISMPYFTYFNLFTKQKEAIVSLRSLLDFVIRNQKIHNDILDSKECFDVVFFEKMKFESLSKFSPAYLAMKNEEGRALFYNQFKEWIFGSSLYTPDVVQVSKSKKEFIFVRTELFDGFFKRDSNRNLYDDFQEMGKEIQKAIMEKCTAFEIPLDYFNNNYRDISAAN